MENKTARGNQRKEEEAEYLTSGCGILGRDRTKIKTMNGDGEQKRQEENEDKRKSASKNKE